MQFYIFVMLLGLPDDKHEEKPSFLQFENNALRTDGRTDRPTDRRTDRPSARTHLKNVRLLSNPRSVDLDLIVIVIVIQYTSCKHQVYCTASAFHIKTDAKTRDPE